MKILPRLVLALLVAAPLLLSMALAEPVRPLERGRPVDPLARFGWIGELVGSCWKGTSSDGKGADVRCYSAPYGRFLRETSRAPAGGATEAPLESESVIAWDPVRGDFEIFLWSSDGAWRRAEATYYKGAYRFQDRNADGSPPTKRTIWRRRGPDAFEVSLERREGSGWTDVRTVTYERSAPADTTQAPAPGAG